MNYNRLFIVLILITKMNECLTLIQNLRLSVFVCILVPHFVNLRSDKKNELMFLNVPLTHATESHGWMRYCDTDSPIYDHDDFMNRIVAISMHKTINNTIGKGQIIATGVFINHNHVLTSYRPFVDLIKNVTKNRMYVYYYRAKWFDETKHHGYYIGSVRFACARQVVPMVKNVRHDLMVIKTIRNMTFLDKPYWGYEKSLRLQYVGPLKTELAGEDDELGDNLKFVSLGFIDDDHIYNRNHLHTVTLNRDDGIIADCEEWCHNEWGYFICIENLERYAAIGSGALLFSGEKVIAVGSFALKKGDSSVLVFTDVRPYIEMINLTCTDADNNTDSDIAGIAFCPSGNCN